MKQLGLIVAIFFSFAWFSPCFALQSDEVLLLANRNNHASVQLAKYYLEKRHIPITNLLTVATTDAEDCTREEYQQQLVKPVREYLMQHQGAKIRCIVLLYGIPLRVAAPELSSQQWRHLSELQHQRKQVEWELKNRKLSESKRQQFQEQLAQLDNELEQLQRDKHGAAVDSEIALVLNKSYPLAGWQPNPYFVGFKQQKSKLRFRKDQVLFVSRIDGPTPAIVRQMIDDSVFAEQNGLQGKAYFDARWPLPDEKKLQGYDLYDASIHRAAELTSKISGLPVHLNQEKQLFQAGEAPHAAIYCGWYSLGKYVDAFTWQRGAVGYHIASSECKTLKKAGSQVWCKRMLEDGVAATIGPVAEPYVQGFPIPELFFSYLLDGYYTLAESYFLSLPYLSWQMILLGDPLYRPFRN